MKSASTNSEPVRELLLFEVETCSDGKQSVKRVVRECSVEKAAALLEVSRSSVLRLYRAGILTGWKPGLALAKKRKTEATNCKVVLDWESVMEFREIERAAQAVDFG